MLAGCSSGGNSAAPAAGAADSGGYIVADEPQAVSVARGILAEGGSVADAGVALALTLAVTLPSRAGLGGGGACLIHSGRPPTPDSILASVISARPQATPTEAVAFLPGPTGPGGTIGLPAMVRGLDAIQAKYGRLDWRQVIAPAENLARFGAPVSRAFMRDIASAKADLTGPDGQPLHEGEMLPQGELADTLAQLRTEGAGALYLGPLGQAYVAGSAGAIDAAALRATVPVLSMPAGVPAGENVIYFTPSPGGALARALWERTHAPQSASLLSRLLPGDSTAAPAGPRQDLAEAASALVHPVAAAGDTPQLAGGDAATGFVVADESGSAMVCSLTMGRLFGAGKLIGRTGILASTPVTSGGSDGLSTVAAIVANENSMKLLGASAGGGDRGAAEALVAVTTAELAGAKAGEAARRPRIYAAGSGPMLAEAGAPTAGRASIAAPSIGIVNSVFCPGGLPGSDPQCSLAADPRGAGLAAATPPRR